VEQKVTKNPMSVAILLLVEDDANLQSMLEIALSGEGFDIVLASNGTEAIAALDADGVRFKGVVTDIRLGAGPNGWEVGKHARETAAGMPIIYMSGDSAHEWSANGVPESVMLQKPFVIGQLITAITTLLNQVSTATALSEAMAHDKTSKPAS
jgi:DNA-binding response OmpR family regulator